MVSTKRQVAVGLIGSLGTIGITTVITVGWFDTGLQGVLRNNLLAIGAFLIFFFILVQAYERYEKMYRQSLS